MRYRAICEKERLEMKLKVFGYLMLILAITGVVLLAIALRG